MHLYPINCPHLGVQSTIVLPGKPESMSGEQLNTSSVLLKWTAVEGATEYRLYRAVDGGDFVLAKVVDTNETANFNLKLAEHSYKYKVAAICTEGEGTVKGEYSEEIEFANMPAAPKNVKAESSGSSAVISWDAVEGATEYLLYRSDDDGDFRLLKSVEGTTTNNYGLESGKKYQYKVVALRRSENVLMKSAYSDAALLTVKAKPAAPQNVKLEQLSMNSVELKWDAVENATEYRIYRSINGADYTLVKVVSENGTANYGLNFENAYGYKIAAVNGIGASGVKGDYSEEVLISGILAAPENVKAVLQSDGSVKLTWDAVEGATEYRLYRKVNNGDYALVKSVEGTETYNFDLDKANVYTYRVTAIETKGNVMRRSDYSIEAVAQAEQEALVEGDFEFAYNADKTGITITKYTGSAATVVVPDTIRDLPVTQIGARPFENNTTLSAITLPDTVEVIGYRAFAGCTSLKTMN